MKRSNTKPNRLGVWGDCMMNQLPSQSRKNRKRLASKRRRAMLKVPGPTRTSRSDGE